MENGKWTDEQREFLGVIRNCRRRMNAAQTWEKLAAAVAVGTVFGLGFEVAAFVLPFYYADLYALLAVVIGVLTGLLIARRGRVSEAAAALKIDSFGFEERVVTAYEGLMSPSGQAGNPLFYLQQRDAMRRLSAGKDRIRIKVLPSAKKIFLSVGLLFLLIVLAFVPSAMKERARELHAVKEESLEKQKEIENVIEELEEFATEELSEEQMAALQEMIKSLQSSSAEYGQASSAKALSAAGQKLDYKYADIGSQLAALAESLQNGAAVSAPRVSAMQEMSQDLLDKSGNFGSDGDGQSGDSQSGADGEGGDGTGNGNGNSNGNNTGDQNGQSGEDGNGEAGEGDGSQNAAGGEGGDGNGNGGNSGGAGDGDGSGTSSNSGGNQNGGSGAGRGTGSAHIDRDYISVPNDVGNDETLTGQAGSSEYSESFKAPTGFGWEGDHVSYDSVIGTYQQKAYEGISNGKYPNGMEDVIKDYFGSFNE